MAKSIIITCAVTGGISADLENLNFMRSTMNRLFGDNAGF